MYTLIKKTKTTVKMDLFFCKRKLKNEGKK
jgi:hypothetical protein